MIQNYSDLTRLEMEQVNKDETIVLIPLGALEPQKFLCSVLKPTGMTGNISMGKSEFSTSNSLRI